MPDFKAASYLPYAQFNLQRTEQSKEERAIALAVAEEKRQRKLRKRLKLSTSD